MLTPYPTSRNFDVENMILRKRKEQMMIPYVDVVKLVDMVMLFHAHDNNGNDELRNNVCADLMMFEEEYPGMVGEILNMNFIKACAKKSNEEQ